MAQSLWNVNIDPPVKHSLVKKSFWDTGDEIFILSDIFHLVGSKDLKDVIDILILSSTSWFCHQYQKFDTIVTNIIWLSK